MTRCAARRRPDRRRSTAFAPVPPRSSSSCRTTCATSRGHFPGAPVVPGVVQIKWAIALAQRYLAIGGGFAGMENVKFQRAMTPGSRVTLTLEYAAAAASCASRSRPLTLVTAAAECYWAPRDEHRARRALVRSSGARQDAPGLRIMYAVYATLGRWAFALLLYPVAAYFYLTARRARRASQEYLARVRSRMLELGQPPRADLEARSATSWISAIAFSTRERRGPAGCRRPASRSTTRSCSSGSRFRPRRPVHRLASRQPRGAARVSHRPTAASRSTRSSPLATRRSSTSSSFSINPQRHRTLDRDRYARARIGHASCKTRSTPASTSRSQPIASRCATRSARFTRRSSAVRRRSPKARSFSRACSRAPSICCSACASTAAIAFSSSRSPTRSCCRARTPRQALELAIARYAQRLEAHCLLAPTQWFNFFDFWGQADSSEQRTSKLLSELLSSRISGS